MPMKLKLILILILNTLLLAAQNKQTEQRPAVVKQDASWNKTYNEQTPSNGSQTITEGIILSTNQNGILITISKSNENIKLFSLTGEVVWAGNLVQGRFFIPTAPGIYFLRINNKSYKIVCK